MKQSVTDVMDYLWELKYNTSANKTLNTSANDFDVDEDDSSKFHDFDHSLLDVCIESPARSKRKLDRQS